MHRLRSLLVVSALAVVLALGLIVYIVARSRDVSPRVAAAPEATIVADDNPRTEPATRSGRAGSRPISATAPETAAADRTPSAVAVQEDRIAEAQEPAAEATADSSATDAAESHGSVVITINGRPMATHTFRASVPIMAEVNRMPLTDEQRAFIDQFSETFSQAAAARIEAHAAAAKEGFVEVARAGRDGDGTLHREAFERLKAITEAQNAEMRQLNREYLDGICGVLSVDQVQTLEKSLESPNRQWTYETVSPDGNERHVVVVGPFATAAPAEPAATESAESAPATEPVP